MASRHDDPFVGWVSKVAPVKLWRRARRFVQSELLAILVFQFFRHDAKARQRRRSKAVDIATSAASRPRAITDPSDAGMVVAGIEGEGLVQGALSVARPSEVSGFGSLVEPTADWF